MVTNQKHSSDVSSEQEVIRRTEKIAKLLGTDKQNAEVYITLSDKNKVLKKQLKEYHSQHNTFERRVKRLETELEDLDECVDRKTVVDLIHEIVPSLINEKSKSSAYSSESSEESDSDDTHVIRKQKDVAHAFALLVKQGRRIQPRKVKRVVFLKR
ncbi:hypothetical protein RhiirA4_453046 [Rhizophagus irregularis]|uniref:Uncharacterized protein n=1 Tax=Rhizophagus irregularis TaxID=588596 RepID=A0A2I1FZI8_9GLOM|nr:hypothetical protein RhiirA4_453046 [Rhizophagus irregularis]